MAEDLIEEGALGGLAESLSALGGLGVSSEFIEKAPEIESFVYGSEQDDSQEVPDEKQKSDEQFSDSSEEGLIENNANVENEESEDISIEHEIFGGKKVVKTKVENDQPVIENKEVVESFLKTIGLDIKPEEFTEKVNHWKQTEETLVQKSKELENVTNLFSLLPPELYEAVNLVAKGQDWRGALQGQSKIDYAKDVNSFSDEDLVEAFFPGEISNEDWEEYKDEDGDPRIKKSIDLIVRQSKEKFSFVKNEKESLSQKAINDQRVQIESYNSSLKNSVSKLPTLIEGISDSYVRSVEKELSSNTSIRDLFFDEKGMMKENAAMAYVMAKDGFSLLEKYKSVIEKRVETEKNLDLLSRGARSPKSTSGKGGAAGAGTELSAEAKAQLEFIRSIG
jgi:hypothetical protein